MPTLSRAVPALAIVGASLLGCSCGPDVFPQEALEIGRWTFNEDLARNIQPDPPLDPAEYAIGQGDNLQIEVRDGLGGVVPDASVDFEVPVSGFVVLPYVGRTKVVGRTVGELREYYRQALADRAVLKEPRVEIFVNRFRRRAVQLGGAVKSAGSHALPDNERRSLRVLILTAGGVQESADVSRITIFRPGELRTYEKSWWELADSGEKFFLEPGDVIEVPSAAPVVVKGEVNRQGEIAFEGKKTTFLRAVQTAGLTKFSDRDIWLRRRDASGRMHEWEIDYDCINESELPDFVLRPGDELYVDNTEVPFLK